ncbi:MAG: hypothetical protein N2312_04910 [Dictyoglomaceae bacterium]|nr:hypothetical protein [Dictyoglomaceae bacterium]
MLKKLIILTTLIISIFLLTNITLAQTENKAYIIGLAIAEDILEDDYGLTLIDGLFSITKFKKFPGTDNFKVYSRWFGTGKHKIKVQIVDSKNNIVKETKEEELVFAKNYETYSFSHDFNNIVFPRAGIYWVQAVLNNKIVFRVPLFVQLFEEELDFKLESEFPVLVFSIPAIEVYEKYNGLQSILGVFEYFAFSKFPSTDDFIVVNGWYSGDGEFSQHIEVLDPDGNVIYVSEPQIFETGPKSITAIYDDLTDFLFTKPGIYIVRVYLEDEPITEYPILVEQR